MPGELLGAHVARPAGARLGQRGGRVGPLARRGRRRGEPLVERLESGQQRVDHRPVAGVRTPHLANPLEPRAQRVDPSRAIGARLARRGEVDREQHTGGAAHRLRQLQPDRAQQRALLGERQPIERVAQGAGRAGEGRARVAVAGFRVERVQVRLGRDQDLAAALEEGAPFGMRRRGRASRFQRVRQRAQVHLAQRVRAGPGGRPDLAPERRLVAVAERQQREREAAHVERCHQGGGADEQRQARGERRAGELTREHRHLERGGGAEVVQERRVRALGKSVGEFLEHQRHRPVRALEGDLLDARLAVDAESELGLPLGDARLLRRARHGAGVERHAERAHARHHSLGCAGDRREVLARLGEGARDLVDEQRAGDAARPGKLGQGDVVVDDDHAHVEPALAGALGGEAEVEPIAGVVLDDQQAARLAGDREDAGEHGVDRGRGEHLAADRRRQHAAPDEPRVRGLVPGPAAGDERDLVTAPVAAHHHLDVRVAIEPGERLAADPQQTIDGVGDERLLRVDELAHGIPPGADGVVPFWHPGRSFVSCRAPLDATRRVHPGPRHVCRPLPAHAIVPANAVANPAIPAAPTGPLPRTTQRRRSHVQRLPHRHRQAAHALAP